MQSYRGILIGVALFVVFGCSPITEKTDSKVIDIAAKVGTGEIVNLSHIADSSVSSAKVKEIAAKLDENDNPVVVIVKMK